MIKVPHKAQQTPKIYKMGELDLVHIGPHTYTNNGLNVDWWGGNTRLIIGNYCSIADGAMFFLSHGHRTDWIAAYPFARGDDYWLAGRKFPEGVVSKGDLVVGHDVWIGNGARILSGVKIGDGAVIGTGAVVTSDVPPYAFVAGNPARVINHRFPPETIALLRRVAWWHWPEDRIRQHLDVLLTSDFDRLAALFDGDPALRAAVAKATGQDVAKATGQDVAKATGQDVAKATAQTQTQAQAPAPTATPDTARATISVKVTDILSDTAAESAPANTPTSAPVSAEPTPQPASAPEPEPEPEPTPVDENAVMADILTALRAGDVPKAAAAGDAALAKGASSAALMTQMMRLHLHLGRNQEAWELGRRLLEREPGNLDCAFQLGLAAMRVNRYEEALARFRQVLDHTPANVEARTNIAAVHFGLGQIREALTALEGALELAPELIAVWQNYVSILNYDETAPLSRVMERHRRAGDRIAKAAPKPQARFDNDRDPNRRLRIGYLSGDFFHHPAAHYLEPVFRHHDRQRFDVHGYSLIGWSDPVTEAFKASIPNWRDVGLLDDEALFQLIQHDRIDILVDLSGHTARNRILVMARKPAPVTVNWIGYLNTIGVKSYDHALLDPHLLSPAAESRFTEKPFKLPKSAYCYTPLIGDRPIAPFPHLANGHITFGCFNNPAKLSQASITAWSDILKANPGSRILFKYKTFAEPSVRERVIGAMADLGVGADRLVFDGFTPLGGFLDSFGAIDIALDSFPYSGVTTTMHTLFMGVPIVSLEGDTPMQRFGRSALHAIGRPDWIASTPGDYVTIANRLVAEVRANPGLRQSVRERMLASPLMRHDEFVRDLEAGYREMWRRWCKTHGKR